MDDKPRIDGEVAVCKKSPCKSEAQPGNSTGLTSRQPPTPDTGKENRGSREVGKMGVRGLANYFKEPFG